ncbi:hypothetical protein [Sorangium sp. So ce388]|uniref:hypothetical protein n=1 Tax=Sorangium sp. So ce388 TaxID=3133309 RepID=UPI003F5B7C47
MNCLNRSALALFFTAALLGSTGCESHDLPIGGGESGSGGEGSGAAALLVARWEGYVENYKFRSGSDKIQIDIDSVEGDEIHGTVRFGAVPSIPPPTDPDVGYPPNAAPENEVDARLPYEGFDFTMLGAELTDRRLRFSVDTRELWTGWCELQASYPMAPGSDSYKCMPNASTEENNNVCNLGGEPVDCGYMHLCGSSVCDCGESGCTINTWGGLDFDFAVDQQEANGSMARESNISNVRLTREP